MSRLVFSKDNISIIRYSYETPITKIKKIKKGECYTVYEYFDRKYPEEDRIKKRGLSRIFNLGEINCIAKEDRWMDDDIIGTESEMIEEWNDHVFLYQDVWYRKARCEVRFNDQSYQTLYFSSNNELLNFIRTVVPETAITITHEEDQYINVMEGRE